MNYRNMVFTSMRVQRNNKNLQKTPIKQHVYIVFNNRHVSFKIFQSSIVYKSCNKTVDKI